VVRPVARYRPGARRGAGIIEPVYLVDRGYSNYSEIEYQSSNPPPVFRSGLDHLVQVYRGSAGKVAEFKPFDLDPPPLTPLDDGGAMDAIINYFDEVSGTDFNGQRQVITWPLFSMLIDNTLYYSLILGSFTTVKLNAVGTVSTGPSAFTRTITSSGFSPHSRYDVMTVAIDLNTGSLESRRTMLYKEDVDVKRYILGIFNRFELEITRERAALDAAIFETLPTNHPFKPCGLQPWQHVASATRPMPPIGKTTELRDSEFLSFNITYYFTQFGVNRSGFPGVGYDLNRFGLPESYKSPEASQAGGLGKRVIRTPFAITRPVWEISSIAQLPGADQCAGLSFLGAFGDDSFKDYSPGAIEEKADIYEIDGLEPLEQQRVLSDIASPVPESIQISSERIAAGLRTQDPLYFFGGPLPSFAQGNEAISGFSIRSVGSVFYLIID
jgi:hypothetical protein